MIPQLFAYALNFPIQKFLQAQRKVFVMAWISVVVLVIHAVLSWLLILKLGYGLVGAAVMLNLSWWLIVISQLLYIFITTSDGAWSGFSMLAFADLYGFVKLSLASAVMLWYLSPSLHLYIQYGWFSMYNIVVVAWSPLQLGVLVLDDTGGDNRSSEEPSDTSWCHLYLVWCFISSSLKDVKMPIGSGSFQIFVICKWFI